MEENGSEIKDGDYAHDKKDHELRQFGCKYCKKKFSNCQALGGHQNAHKLERALSKSKAGMGNAGIPGFGYQGSYSVYPYLNVFPAQPYPELVPFTSTTRPYAHSTPFVGLGGHSYPSWFRLETRNYEAPRSQLIVGGNNLILDRGSSSAVHGVTSSNVTDYISVLDDSRREHKGNSELDLTLKL